MTPEPDGSAEEGADQMRFPLFLDKYYAVESWQEESPSGRGTVRVKRYTFNMTGGYAVFFYDFQPDGQEETLHLVSADGVFSDVDCIVTEDGLDVSRSVSAVLSFLPSKEPAFFLHPVYQEADGRIYATIGWRMEGLSHNSEGGTFGMENSEEQTFWAGEAELRMSSSVSVDFCVAFAPERISVLSMSDDGRLLRRDDFEPAGMPAAITPDPETDYLILETLKMDAQGSPVVSRQLAGRSEGSVTTGQVREDGFVTSRRTEIIWP